MVKGGYQIIDLKGIPLTSGVGMQYEGLYDLIEGTRKVIMLSGISIDDVEYHDCFVEPVVDGTNFNIVAYGKTIVIADTDVVTVQVVQDDEPANGENAGEETDVE